MDITNLIPSSTTGGFEEKEGVFGGTARRLKKGAVTLIPWTTDKKSFSVGGWIFQLTDSYQWNYPLYEFLDADKNVLISMGYYPWQETFIYNNQIFNRGTNMYGQDRKWFYFQHDFNFTEKWVRSHYGKQDQGVYPLTIDPAKIAYISINKEGRMEDSGRMEEVFIDNLNLREEAEPFTKDNQYPTEYFVFTKRLILLDDKAYGYK